MTRSYYTLNDDQDAALKAAQVRFMYRLSILGTVAGTLIALALGGHVWVTNGGTVAPAFMLYFLILGIVRGVVYVAYRRADDIDLDPGAWLAAAMVTMAASGIGWGWAALAFFDQSPLPTLVVLTAMGVSGLLLLAASTLVLAAFNVPLFAGLFYQLLVAGQPAYFVLAGIVGLVAVAMLFQAWFIRRGIREALATQLDRDRLGRLLADSHRQREALVEDLQTETRRRARAEEDVRAAKISADAANMAKDEFLATMSHEIRTPLNGILPILDILRGTQLNETQRDYLDTAFQSSKHLLNIIDDILDYSKIEAGKLELETVGINLREVLDSVLRLMAGSAERKGLRMGVEIDADVRLAMRGDPVRLRQVLTNLVSNAVKFTEQGAVTIGLSRRQDFPTETELLFTVRDTGVGMDKKTADRLFRPFSQADASTTRTYGGTGLGLAICKRLVELMGGRIGVKSQPGSGSVFWFTARLKKAVGDIDVRHRELAGSRALLASADGELGRRLALMAQQWELKLDAVKGLNEAANRLRNAAELGAGWQVETLIIDARGKPGDAAALATDIRRDARLENMGVLLLTGKEELSGALAGQNRILTLPWDASEARLRDAVETLRAGGGAPPSQAVDERELLPEAPAEGRSLAGRVLLVEDNPVNLHVAEKLLQVVGLEFDVAHNGEEALERLTTNHERYQAVLMDCMMPVMDGYQATQAWREHEAATGLERLPIIAMTANAMAGDRQKCLDAGMDDYMSKPMNRALLRQTLQRWIGKAPTPAPALEHGSTTPRAAGGPEPPRTPSKAAVGAGTGGAPVIDQAVLGDLADIMGPDFDTLVGVYLDDAPRILRQLARAAEENAPQNMITPAHSLKSTSANLGATALAELARALELEARSGRVEQPKRRVAQMIRAYKEVAEQLRKTLPRTA